MKQIKSLFVLMIALSACLFTACEQENKGTIYNPENQGLSFTFGTVSLSAPANNPIISVPIYRSVAGEAYTANIVSTVSEASAGITVPSSISFESGSLESSISINLGALTVGKKATIKINLDEKDASAGGISTITVTANKEYVYQKLGTGTFTDNWSSGKTYNVEIQKAEGFERYRIIDPYKESLTNDDGDWGSWIALSTRASYIELWKDNEIIFYDTFALGLNYQAVSTQPIKAYHPSKFDGLSSKQNKKLDDKTIQLAPYFYVSGMGGWNESENDGVIIITLP